ncbi:ethanolamine kinase 2 [Bombina bombina]|uniref:ethanolamine kinase 2 n=1 Tax=Bombina bombina TaxID=8345 RepID=UPI00235A60A6|nr:ethanolamine kinase 2 [Bombina bombina]
MGEEQCHSDSPTLHFHIDSPMLRSHGDNPALLCQCDSSMIQSQNDRPTLHSNGDSTTLQSHSDSPTLPSRVDLPTLRSLNISVDEKNVIPGALSIIRELRPDWNPGDVQTKLFTDGITNKLLACFVDTGMEDAVLVRIYGKQTELFVDREDEVTSFQLLRAHGCAPALYCTFQNGLCYEFMRGLALGPEHVREPHILRLITHEMARYHSIPAHNGCLPKLVLWQKLRKYLSILRTDDGAQSRLPLGTPSLKVLEEELYWLKTYLPTLGSPIVLCHNDLLCKNVIYNEADGHVRFIDYEYAGYNYQAYDIANHFNEFAGVSEPDYQMFPNRQTQIQWLRHYLSAYRRLMQEEGEVPESEVETLFVQVNQFVLASHLFWGLWALIQHRYSDIDFNFGRYAVLRFKRYFEVKPEVTALRTVK